MLKKTEARNSLKSLKARNRRLVLAFLRDSGSVSVNEISRATGLSKMTVHKIIDYYIREGMVILAGKGDSTEEGGKKPNLFAFNSDCRYIFVLRLDGERLGSSIVDLRGANIVERQWHSVDGLNFQEVMTLVGRIFRDQTEQQELSSDNCLAVVAGCGGVFDQESGIVLVSYRHPEWGTNFSLRDSLRQQFPEKTPVYIDSWWRHIAHGLASVEPESEYNRFYLIGNSWDRIAGCLVIDGRVRKGASGFAGELGHMVVDAKSGEKCLCGATGCLEALVAPRRLAARLERLQNEYPDSTVFSEDRGWIRNCVDAVSRAAESGDAMAKRVFDEVIDYFAAAINNIIHICDPGKVVFTGDYAKTGEYFLGRLRQRIGELSMPGIDKRTPIECAEQLDDNGEKGAATYVMDTMFAGIPDKSF